MKTKLLLLSALLLTAVISPGQTSESIDDKPFITGAEIDAANDFFLLRDASDVTPPFLRKVRPNQVPLIPNLWTAVPDGSFSIAKTSGLQTALDSKQATLVSGNNLKTVNGTSLLGSGDVTVSGGTWGSITGTLSSQTDLNLALAGKLSADGSSATLKTANILGADRLTEGNRAALSRWYLRRTRAGQGAGGVSDQNRIRVVDIGDSVVAPFGKQAQRYLGYGGIGLRPGEMTTTGTTASDQWSRTPTGKVITLASGQTIDVTPAGMMTAASVSYLASSTGGSFKLSYQVNKTGGYVDATSAWSIHSLSRLIGTTNGSPTILFHNWAGVHTGMTVTGTGIPGGATLTAINPATTVTKTGCVKTSGSATVSVPNTTGLAPGMICEEEGWMIQSINVAGNTITMEGTTADANATVTLSFRGTTGTLSANATGSGNNTCTFAATDAGSDAGSGILNTANSGAERYSVAWIPLPNSNEGADYYNLRITCTSGTVAITSMGTECGGFGIAKTSGFIRPSGVFRASWDEGGKRLNDHFNAVTSDVFVRALGHMDPEIISFKSLNDWGTASYAADMGAGITRWQQYVNKIRAAAPNALMLVYSSHPSRALPTQDDPADGWVQMDNWMREWCAADGKAVFVELRSNSPAFDNFAGSDGNMWSDNLHLYSHSSTLRGGGDVWSGALGLQAIQPILDVIHHFSVKPTSRNAARPLPGQINQIRLYNDEAPNGYDSYLTLDIPRRSAGGLVLRSPSGTAGVGIGSDQASGITIEASDAANNRADALTIWSGGAAVTQYSRLRGARWCPGGTNNPEFAQEGWRFLQPSNVYNKAGLIAEGRSGTTQPILGVTVAASESSLGNPLWSWLANGNVEYEGTTSDAFETTYAHEEPTSDTTITRVVNATAGTGTYARVMAPVPSYANQAAGEAAVGQWEAYYDEATKKVRVDPNP